MTARQESKMNMYNAVINYFNKNMTIVESFAALKTTFTTFTGIISLIPIAALGKAKVIKGLSLDKRKVRKILIREAVALAAKIYAYANSIDSNELKERVDYPASALSRLKDDELPIACQDILDAAKENLAELEPYRVTQESNNAFAQLIAQYKIISVSPRIAAGQRTTHVTSLRDLFHSADNILKKQMDKIMKGFISENVGFYTDYINIRFIVDPSTTPSQLKGKITDAATNKPVSGALIQVSDNIQTATTDDKGRFIMKPLLPGPHSVIISKEGYVSKTIAKIAIKRGRVGRLEEELVPVAQAPAPVSEKVKKKKREKKK